MIYLAGAVAVLAALTVLNLVLTAGVVARLKEHATRLSESSMGLAKVDQPLPAVGRTIDPVVAVDTDGIEVAVADDSVVAFVTPHCPPCKEQLPAFLAFAAGVPGGRDTVLAVVAGAGAEAEELVRVLRPVARVIVEDHDGPVQRAFGTRALPTFCLLGPDGRVAAATPRANELSAGIPA